jgi:hypothetical protein
MALQSLGLCALALCTPAAAALSVELDADTPWVLSQQTATEVGGLDPALALALRDLRKDWCLLRSTILWAAEQRCIEIPCCCDC